MRPKISMLVQSCAVLLGLHMANVQAVQNGTTLTVLNAQGVQDQCQLGQKRFEQAYRLLLGLPVQAKADQVLAAWNRLEVAQQDVEGPMELFNAVSPDAAVRAAAEPCLVAMTKRSTALLQDVRLYRQLKRVKTTDPVQKKLRDDLLARFEDTGVNLPQESRTRLGQLIEELETVRQTFDRNVRDNPSKFIVTDAELAGLPEVYVKALKKNAAGQYELGFSYPEYRPFMMYADNADARKRYQLAFTNRGTPQNLEFLDRLVTLRQEMAKLLGYSDYAALVLRHRMAKSTEAVNAFLKDVYSAVDSKEAADLEALRRMKAAAEGTDWTKTSIERWDIEYWLNRYEQQNFQLDQETLRQYFPAHETVAWAFGISEDLYGVKFQRRQVPVWHEEVEYYDVVDAKLGGVIGGIYLDLFPRTAKYSHAAAFPVQGASTEVGRLPISVLVTNFNRKGFNASELRTLLHEFGHVLHGVLSRTRYAGLAGTSVERDFVEAPSQMYEAWATRLETLSLMSRHCQQCPVIDAALVNKMRDADRFGKGIHYARQWLYASYDMALYSQLGHKALPLWVEMESKGRTGHVPGSQFPGQFGHVAGGYSAGYYGYLWSEVVAHDLVSAYGQKLMQPAVGRRFRSEVLERGGERTGSEMVERFLKRPSNSKAFYDHLNGRD